MMRVTNTQRVCRMIREARVWLTCGVLFVGLAALPTAAQINDPSVQEGNIELLKTDAPVLHYALAGGFLLAALAIGFKPSKRAAEQQKK